MKVGLTSKTRPLVSALMLTVTLPAVAVAVDVSESILHAAHEGEKSPLAFRQGVRIDVSMLLTLEDSFDRGVGRLNVARFHLVDVLPPLVVVRRLVTALCNHRSSLVNLEAVGGAPQPLLAAQCSGGPPIGAMPDSCQAVGRERTKKESAGRFTSWKVDWPDAATGGNQEPARKQTRF
jgi:hypothetical protein